MTRISELEFNIAMKVASDRCLACDVADFLSLDTSDVTVAKSVQKRVYRHISFDTWKNVRKVTAKAAKCALIVLVSAITLFFAAAMSVQPVRSAFFGAIVTWYEDYIDVKYDGGDTDGSKDFTVYKTGYLPDGWSVSYEFTDKASYVCDITDGDEGFVRYSQIKDSESGISIDSDVYEEEIVYIKNDTVEANLFISDDGGYVLVWKDVYMFKFEAENVELEELIMIAEGLG